MTRKLLKIVLYVFAGLVQPLFGQSNDALKKLKEATTNYTVADKKAKDARNVLDKCFKINNVDGIKGCARDVVSLASGASAYARKAEVRANEVKESKDVCPYAKYLAERAAEYFSLAQQRFSDAYTELSKINSESDAPNDMQGVTINLQNAVGFLAEASSSLDAANGKVNEAVEAIKDNCKKKY